VASFVHNRDNVEVSSPAQHEGIFIRWGWHLGGQLHEILAGSRASVDVVSGGRNAGRRVPPERNAMVRSFVTAAEAGAKSERS
jgi:hypothetical protein